MAILFNISAFNYLLTISFGGSICTLVGKNISKNKRFKAQKYAKMGFVILQSFINILNLCLLVAPEMVMKIYSDEPNIVAAGILPLRVMAFG